MLIKEEKKEIKDKFKKKKWIEIGIRMKGRIGLGGEEMFEGRENGRKIEIGWNDWRIIIIVDLKVEEIEFKKVEIIWNMD